MKLGITVGFLMALASCQKNDDNKPDEGTDRSITRNTQSAKPAEEAAEIDLGERGRASVTAEDQGESEVDRSITSQVRQALMNHDRLSMNAKNVQVVTKDGVVTLRGEVANESEKALLAELAQGAPGVTHIDNQLDTVDE